MTSKARPVQVPLFAAGLFVCCTPVDRAGIAAYCHLVWAPEDPRRSPRPKGGREDRAPHKTQKETPVAAWRARLEEHLADGVPRTFNRICVEMLDQEASIAFDGPLDVALWELVAEGALEHTMEVPVYFRRAAGDCG